MKKLLTKIVGLFTKAVINKQLKKLDVLINQQKEQCRDYIKEIDECKEKGNEEHTETAHMLFSQALNTLIGLTWSYNTIAGETLRNTDL